MKKSITLLLCLVLSLCFMLPVTAQENTPVWNNKLGSGLVPQYVDVDSNGVSYLTVKKDGSLLQYVHAADGTLSEITSKGIFDPRDPRKNIFHHTDLMEESFDYLKMKLTPNDRALLTGYTVTGYVTDNKGSLIVTALDASKNLYLYKTPPLAGYKHPSAIPPEEPSVSDIKDHWAKESIQQLLIMGVVNGFEDHTFRPEAEVTREQFMKMIFEVLETRTFGDGRQIFQDVPKDRWSNVYIEAAVDMGYLIKDEYGSNFGPATPITRQEMATIVARILKLSSNAKLTYKDSDSIKKNRQLIQAAAEAGIITGFPDNTFRPDAHATRAQAAVIIVRVINKQLAKP